MLKYLIFVIIFYFILIRNSYSYLDPGSASIFFQALVGGIIAGLTTILYYWNKVKIWVKKKYNNIKKLGSN